MSKFDQLKGYHHGQFDPKARFAPMVEDARDPAKGEQYDKLDAYEYLDVVWEEMKNLYNNCDFQSRRRNLYDKVDELWDENLDDWQVNILKWPVTPSRLFEPCTDGFKIVRHTRFPHVTTSLLRELDKIFDISCAVFMAESGAETEAGARSKINTVINFMDRTYGTSIRFAGENGFRFKNAVIRAKFVGDDSSHSFYVGEGDELCAGVFIRQLDDSGKLLALLVNGKLPDFICKKLTEEPERHLALLGVTELEEFTILSSIDAEYYEHVGKNCMGLEDLVVYDDLMIFTHYSKERNLFCDTTVSFKNGLSESIAIYCHPGADEDCEDDADYSLLSFVEPSPEVLKRLEQTEMTLQAEEHDNS